VCKKRFDTLKIETGKKSTDQDSKIKNMMSQAASHQQQMDRTRLELDKQKRMAEVMDRENSPKKQTQV
jgi:hypothetical protein